MRKCVTNLIGGLVLGGTFPALVILTDILKGTI